MTEPRLDTLIRRPPALVDSRPAEKEGQVMSKPDPNDKRQRHVASVVQYLRIEFLAYDVAPFPEYRIKVRELGRGKVIHEVAFHIAFLDDHDDPVKEVRRLGLVQRMKEKGSETVWVNTREVS